MFKRISIILLILFTLLAFTIGASAVASGLFMEKDAGNTYIDYVDADGTSIMKIDHLAGVTIPTLSTTTLTSVTNYTEMVVTGTVDASSLTTGSITTAGGMSIKKQLYLGDDLDMSQTAASGTYDITLRTNLADALSITDGADIIMFRTASTRMVTITPALTVTGDIISDSGTDAGSATTGAIQTDGGIGIVKALWVGTTSRLVGNVQIDGSLTISESGAGMDVKIWGNNALYFTWFDASADTNGAWFIGGEDQKGLDMTWYGAAASSYMKWDRSVDDLLLAGAGVVFSGTQAEGIIFGGTVTNEVIKIGGTYDHGIYFTEDMVATDVTNSFINIGDYTTAIAVVPSGANMFGVVHNVTMAVNVSYWYQAYYTKITTSSTTDDTSIAGHAYRMVIGSDLVAVYGVQSHVIISGARTFTSEVSAGSFYLDVGSTSISSVGSRTNALQAVVIGSATVTSNFTVADFSASTNASLDAILHLHIVASASATSTLHIENDGTTTNMLYIDNNGTATVGILYAGSIATGISLAGTYSTAAIAIASTGKITFYDADLNIYAADNGDLVINADVTLIVTCPSVTFAGTIAASTTYGVLIDYDAPFLTIGNIHSAMLDLDVTTTSNVSGGIWSAWGRLYGARITVNLAHKVTNTYAIKAKVLTTGTTNINDVVGVFGELEIDGTHTYGQADSSMAALRGDISNLSGGSWTGQVYTLFLNFGSGENYGLETAWIHAYNHGDSYLDYGIHMIQNSTVQAIAVGIWLDIESSTTVDVGILLDNGGTLTVGMDITSSVTAIDIGTVSSYAIHFTGNEGYILMGASTASRATFAAAGDIVQFFTRCNVASGVSTGLDFEHGVGTTGATSLQATAIRGVLRILSGAVASGNQIYEGAAGYFLNEGELSHVGLRVAALRGAILDGGTYTNVDHLSVIWADTQLDSAVTGDYQLFLGTNNGSTVLDQMFSLYGNADLFLKGTGMTEEEGWYHVTEDKATTSRGWLKLEIGGNVRYIALYVGE